MGSKRKSCNLGHYLPSDFLAPGEWVSSHLRNACLFTGFLEE